MTRVETLVPVAGPGSFPPIELRERVKSVAGNLCWLAILVSRLWRSRGDAEEL